MSGGHVSGVKKQLSVPVCQPSGAVMSTYKIQIFNSPMPNSARHTITPCPLPSALPHDQAPFRSTTSVLPPPPPPRSLQQAISKPPPPRTPRQSRRNKAKTPTPSERSTLLTTPAQVPSSHDPFPHSFVRNTQRCSPHAQGLLLPSRTGTETPLPSRRIRK